jgi:hypothetical protein
LHFEIKRRVCLQVSKLETRPTNLQHRQTPFDIPAKSMEHVSTEDSHQTTNHPTSHHKDIKSLFKHFLPREVNARTCGLPHVDSMELLNKKGHMSKHQAIVPCKDADV